MTRLVATIGCDVRLQNRNGFYWAVAFVLAAWGVLITQLPAFDWRPWLPPLLLGNLQVATFYFVGGLVLLEKSEGTIEAQVVTPLTAGEYLSSKVVTLTALSIVESLVLVLLAHGPGFRWGTLLLGVVLMSVLYCLLGFAVVARYDSINEYLFPSVIYTTLFYIPLLDYVGLWETRLMVLHPLQAALVVIEAAFRPVPAWEWIYGVAYSAVWILLAFVWSRRAFRRFVIARAGRGSR